MVNDAAVSAFRSRVRGAVITPADAGYDDGRKVYNGIIERRPALIVKCVDAADVITAVNLGRDQKMLVAVRGGGHNAGGLGVCHDGLVIDLSHIS